jgi:hypothetical protein
MFKNFLMKAMLKSQMKNVPKEQQEMLLMLVEKNPDFFQKIALEIQEKINNRPRKCLNYLTPNEVVAQFLA